MARKIGDIAWTSRTYPYRRGKKNEYSSSPESLAWIERKNEKGPL